MASNIYTFATLCPILLDRIRQTTTTYPRQFWLLFWGTLISSAGSNMVWVFLTIYLRQRLDIPLTIVALLLTVHTVAGLVATSIAGPAVDRFGRKGIMVLTLAAGSLTLAAMRTADTVPLWGILMAASGASTPLFRVGLNAMAADLVEPELRAAAYALLRIAFNLGVAISALGGGVIIALSYNLVFHIAAGAQLAFSLLILLFAAETVPRHLTADQPHRDGGYGPLLNDRSFLAFCGVYTLTGIAYTLMMQLLPVYAKENFGVPENQYGFIMATNAVMIVLFQYATTRITARYPHLRVLAIGSLFCALGVGSVGWGGNFPTFLMSMVILTIGEMIVAPTSTALAANMAPPDMRGRYMGVFGLTWWIALGIGPVVGGLLNDNVTPVATWYGGLAIGVAAALGFVLMSNAMRGREPASTRMWAA